MELNRIYNEDWMNNNLPDKCIDLIIADPPYFEVKGDFDFIWPSFEAYLNDVERWAIECKRVLKDNGTIVWWGHAKKIAYSQTILDRYFNLENVVKWRKTDCRTRIGCDVFNSFPPVTEHFLVYSQDEINIRECIYSIREYIRNEIIKSKGKVVLKDVNIALGTAVNGGGVASACLSLDKTEPAMLTKEMYEKLQAWLNPYLAQDYDDLRKDYENKRRYFNNYMKLDDVWDFPQDVHITGLYKHDTQKTEKISRIIINSCSRIGDTMLIPFAGSGTECAMAIKENRNYIGYEIDPKHYNTTINRCLIQQSQQTLF